MKKIMFNDKYGLTQAVLDGRKTMTRRIIKGLNDDADVSEWGLDDKSPYIIDYNDPKEKEFRPRYQLGEVIAIAQAYKDTPATKDFFKDADFIIKYKGTKGWNNKMFVKADLMPHHIKITNVNVERLQDISVEDCLKTGIGVWESPYYCEPCYHLPITSEKVVYYNTPGAAIAALIDKVNGKGTWKNNPWCFCYEFELID